MVKNVQQILFVLAFVWGCSSSNKKKTTEPVEADGGSEESAKAPEESKQEEESVDLSNDLRPFFYSERNNGFTSKTVNKKEAKEIVADLEEKLKKGSKDVGELAGFITVQVLADEPLDAVIRSIKRLIDLEMRKDVAREVPDVSKLQLVLAAIASKNFALAEYYLYELSSSKNKNVKVAALNAEAFIAMSDDRLPEAIATWNSVLKLDPDNQAARLNIGFYSLKYGDYATATSMLGRLQDDWFALYGLLVAERLAGNSQKVASLCDEVEDKKKNYKPAMLSCALNAYQGEKKYDRAITMLNALVKAEPAIPQIDEKAYKLITEIEEAKLKKDSKPKGPKKQKEQKQPEEGEQPRNGTEGEPEESTEG
jgi:tetratricopeptide (TPR) repeat protein